jgi:hypothetical protein
MEFPRLCPRGKYLLEAFLHPTGFSSKEAAFCNIRRTIKIGHKMPISERRE